MDFPYYQAEFKKAADKLDKRLLNKKKAEVAVGVVLNSVFLKLYKKSWANESPDPLTVSSRIFFSIWIGDLTIREQKIYYNIHALKLRQLEGYAITSRDFATKFRAGFRSFKKDWPNVSVDFGPLTLMEGWIKLDLENLQDDILKLANQFLKIDKLVDDTLAYFKD